MKIKKKLAIWHKYLVLYFAYLKKVNLKIPKKDKKTIIICFDGRFSHGGFVDRLKGIISFYEVAKQLNLNFKIHFVSPFDLNIYFKPNVTDWTINEKDIKYYLRNTKILYLNGRFDIDPIQIVNSTQANYIYVYSNIDYLSKIYTKKSNDDLKKIWNNNFYSLFRFSEILKKSFNKLPNSNYNVFHTRFTSLMGDFIDSSIKTISELEKKDLINNLMEEINLIIKDNANKKFYVLSDSVIFLDYIKKNTNLNVLEGKPKHLDFNKGDENIDAHTKTITDFLFIAGADEIFLLKKGRMYNSAFSRYAAIVGNKKFHLIN